MLHSVGQIARFAWSLTCKVASVATGVMLILAGIALSGWVLYNLFIEEMPEAKGRDPWGAVHFSVFLIGMGVVFVRD